MRKYRLIKETNLSKGNTRYIIQARTFMLFWTDILDGNDIEAMYSVLLKLQHPEPKHKFKREEVAIDNIYV